MPKCVCREHGRILSSSPPLCKTDLPSSVVGLCCGRRERKQHIKPCVTVLDVGAIPSRRSGGGRVYPYPGGYGKNPYHEDMPERAGELNCLNTSFLVGVGGAL